MPEEAATMTAIVLPDIDHSTIEELKKRIPDLSEIELTLPSRKDVSRTAREVGKTADETIDRLLGRKPAPIWPWIAAGIGLVAVIGAVAAWFAWFRRPTWERQSESFQSEQIESEHIESEPIASEPWQAPTSESGPTTVTSPADPGFDDRPVSPATATRSRSAAGRTAAAGAGSTPDPIEEA
jgi:hypothetical protein